MIVVSSMFISFSVTCLMMFFSISTSKLFWNESTGVLHPFMRRVELMFILFFHRLVNICVFSFMVLKGMEDEEAE